MEEYFPAPQDLDDFIAWLEARGERVDILPTLDQKGLEDLVKVQDNVVSLTEAPENMRVVSVISRRAPLTPGSTLPILIG